MMYLAYSVAWISSAAVAISGLYLTGSAWCIWVMLLPALLKIDGDSKENKSTEGE